MIKPEPFYKLGRYSVLVGRSVFRGCIPRSDANDIANELRQKYPHLEICILNIQTNKLKKVK